ncbi:MAG: sensor histidine kinase [Bacteroidetes bacterium]|nr:sensor histidine kinase [Bacteroidota bacterium]MBT3748880.1 sensor histidine kinase [Bacteroidota bacterium]MBT4401023.1 sensor histidine kinase [Bacteroidota bacterium]MBT4412116.1 sensor histidine kinase [Bacteroidota bacterium]
MNKKQYLLIRFLMVFMIHVIFKLFDLSFSSFLEISWRSLTFSIFFLSYWMIAWEIASRIYQRGMGNWIGLKEKYGRLFWISILEMLFAVVMSILFNYLYQIGDWFIFNNSWTDVAVLNPELVGDFHLLKEINVNPELLYGLLIFFILIYSSIIFIDLFRHVKEMEVSTAILKHENTQAKYQALKNQIDPHFFFNSLSVLSSLIYESADESARYISHLSKLYRSILESGSGQFISLRQELEVLDSYLFLLRIRFNEAFKVNILLSDDTLNKTVIIPHTLQMLIENAVKHNALTTEQPLIIRIEEDESSIVIRNNIRPKRLLEPKSGIGLVNINMRYNMATNQKVEISNKNKEFKVKLPKINHEHPLA